MSRSDRDERRSDLVDGCHSVQDGFHVDHDGCLNHNWDQDDSRDNHVCLDVLTILT